MACGRFRKGWAELRPTATRRRHANPDREANETPLADTPMQFQSAADYGREDATVDKLHPRPLATAVKCSIHSSADVGQRRHGAWNAVTRPVPPADQYTKVHSGIVPTYGATTSAIIGIRLSPNT